jgi:hypothetical protein
MSDNIFPEPALPATGQRIRDLLAKHDAQQLAHDIAERRGGAQMSPEVAALEQRCAALEDHVRDLNAIVHALVSRLDATDAAREAERATREAAVSQLRPETGPSARAALRAVHDSTDFFSRNRQRD